jgi:hypothetical protein
VSSWSGLGALAVNILSIRLLLQDMSILVEGDSHTIYNMGDIRALARLILLERRLGGRVQSDNFKNFNSNLMCQV